MFFGFYCREWWCESWSVHAMDLPSGILAVRLYLYLEVITFNFLGATYFV
jgi:hypothetical protein